MVIFTIGFYHNFAWMDTTFVVWSFLVAAVNTNGHGVLEKWEFERK